MPESDGVLRRIIITGASSGIGAQTAFRLAGPDLHFALGYRNDYAGARRTADQVKEAGALATVFEIDQSDPEAASSTLDRIITELGGLDVLINNAGVNRRSFVVDESFGGIRSVLNIDAVTPMLLASRAAITLKRQGTGGRIINITSVHEHIPIEGGLAYCSAKAALGMATQVMALELASDRITVNSVAPGETATPMNGAPPGTSASNVSRPAIPMGRPADVRDVAGAVAYLAAPEAAYITGQSIVVDGGMQLTAAIANAAHANEY